MNCAVYKPISAGEQALSKKLCKDMGCKVKKYRLYMGFRVFMTKRF
jgi:hypothetical protein